MWYRFSHCLLMAGMLVAISGIGQPARAQDDAGPEEERPAQPRRTITMTDDQVERWVVGRLRGPERNLEDFEARLTSRIKGVDLMYKLSPEQKKKLEVAGRGDLKRLSDRIEELKESIHRAQGDVLRIRSILTKFQPSRNPPDLFGDDSLFAKTLKKTLTPEQRAKEEKWLYGTHVEWTVSSLDHPIGLGPEQHERLVSVIAKQTRPLKRYGVYDDDAVLLQAARLPAAQLKPIFDEAQWWLLYRRFELASQLEKILIAEGYLPTVEPEGTRPVEEGAAKPVAADARMK